MNNSSASHRESTHSLQHPRVPLVVEALADLDTPLSTYLKLADAPYSFLLESVQGGERWGRYSIIGLPCAERIRVRGHTLVHERDDAVLEQIETDDPLAWIQAFNDARPLPRLPELPRLTGGLVGYFGYDTIRYIEPRLAAGGAGKDDPLGLPDILLLIAEELVIFDNLSGKLYCVAHYVDGDEADRERVARRLDALLDRLEQPLTTSTTRANADEAPSELLDDSRFVSGLTQTGYEDAVRRIRDYTQAGDVMQVVPSQRLSAPFNAEPMSLYRALRSLNPSPYMYYFNFGDHHVVGASPEILVRAMDGEVTVRPIAGTRKRGATASEDEALAEDLLKDPKEIAEHLMLIDLGRNDVGRVSQPGSVKLTERMAIERYSHVMHIVSNVTGKLRDDLTPMDALRAAFPAGTLSGAPKIRAMEIIDEIEPVKRGVYGGAVGYLAGNGSMDLAIAIRTAVLKDGEIHVQAGGGIVADSQPTAEWEETMNKAKAVMKAAAIAERGLSTRAQASTPRNGGDA
ncbi:Anthranilate synthase component 1 protein [Salinisphaera shabanensis E1L3A]|uniref:Anthranilate synthase component 1 n=1 Tax=Salinisphaera shabanensis E1L3A TaxID=1033802 RepID=U2E628_9GAMM|nr:anthranilate synthase component I [Salinisphaera shabanensis]ERJ19236.1 Anthranilate synthase component 1 protein [Salinisphaera shabanensis E1L3A]